MFEKVNPSHPDKIADRIAGALVDLAYKKEPNPKIAVEVLLGHGICNIIVESSPTFYEDEVQSIVDRIAGEGLNLNYIEVAQDKYLAGNQADKIRCGDNGIFKGAPLTEEQKRLSGIAHHIYNIYESDGKYIINKDDFIICQSNVTDDYLKNMFPNALINPLGNWTGGTEVDSGATNRKLGSDMGDGITGGGLHGKDCSKADVSVNIYAFLKAQKTGEPVELYCAIGDEMVDGLSYAEVVRIAHNYIKQLGGFEKFAEWGLV